jgi:hypothetical protein
VQPIDGQETLQGRSLAGGRIPRLLLGSSPRRLAKPLPASERPFS